MKNCKCHCHNNHEGYDGVNSHLRCKCIPRCKHCDPTAKWDDYGFTDDPIFDLLNCYEIDGSEIHNGMAHIDSGEAEVLTKRIRQILERDHPTPAQTKEGK